MKLPDIVKSIRARYVAAFPVPQGEPSEAFEERARQWSIAFAEQVAFELPGQGWGMKRADPGRPISKDTLARDLGDGVIRIWDLLTGTGTGAPRLAEDPDAEDLTGQVFVQVRPTDRLGVAFPVEQPQRPPTVPANGDSAEQLAVLAGQVAAMTSVVNEMRDSFARASSALVEQTTIFSQIATERQAIIQTLLEEMTQGQQPQPQPSAWSNRYLRLTPEYPKKAEA